jgi:hypothetical protein
VAVDLEVGWSKNMRLAILALCALAAFGADVIEPEFADVFYRLDGGKLVALERQASAKIHVGPFASSVKNEIPGGRSPIRFQADQQQPIEFVFKSVSPSDPAGLYHLRRLTAGKNKREALIMKTRLTSPLSATSQTGDAANDIPVTFSRYGTGSIKATAAALPPGEYAIGLSYGAASAAMFCFGID